MKGSLMNETKKQIIERIEKINKGILNKRRNSEFHEQFRILLLKKTKDELYETLDFIVNLWNATNVN